MKNVIRILLVLVGIGLYAQDVPTTFTNPILPGGYPDPSILRVGDTYYIANSSFIWYPGVPIHKSKDLVNWELVGYALNTPKHLDINDKTGAHGGIWAPTLRYHKGLFYLTVTQRSCGTSIVSTAKDPAGPWTVPVTLHSQDGIDGSLLFDKKKVWYTWSEDHKIWLREFDPKKMELIGETTLLLDEDRYGDDYTNIEGPHIYKLESGEYMLLIAAGGTGSNNHNVSVFKSDAPKGPYKPNPKNPVLTHAGKDSPFNNMGHADIVETPNGEWYAVMLGVRPNEGYTIMDRETFMVGFHWEDGWPVFDNEGMVLPVDKRPDLPWSPVTKKQTHYDFDTKELPLDFNFYHTPYEKWYSLDNRPGWLEIEVRSPSTEEQKNSSTLARRITQFDFKASTLIDFDPKNKETAGLIAIMNQRGQMRLEVFEEQGKNKVRLVYTVAHPRKGRTDYTSIPVEFTGNKLELALEARGLDYNFYANEPNEKRQQIGETLNGSILSRQRVGSYSGAYVGIFASGNGADSDNRAAFDYFQYTVEELKVK